MELSPIPARKRNLFLWWALGLSCAVHLVFGFFVPLVQAKSEEPQPTKISLLHRFVVPTPRPPTPPPRQQPRIPQRTRPAHPQHSVPHVHPVHTKNRGGHAQSSEPAFSPAPSGTEEPIAEATPLATPAATPLPATPAPATPRPSCRVPNREATTTRAVEPDVPEIARQEGAVGVAQIQVSLGPDGAVRSVSIYQSTGNSSLDQAALGAARASSYAPALEECAPVAGTYLFRVEFSGQ